MQRKLKSKRMKKKKKEKNSENLQVDGDEPLNVLAIKEGRV